MVVFEFPHQNKNEIFYQKLHNFVKSCQEILSESQNKNEDVEKFYSVLVNEKKDGLLLFRDHLASFIYLFDDLETSECERKEYKVVFENKIRYYCKTCILYFCRNYYNQYPFICLR